MAKKKLTTTGFHKRCFFSWYLWKMPAMGCCPVRALSALMLKQMVILVGGQRAELREGRVCGSHLAGWHYCQPAVLHVAGQEGQLCPCCQLCLCSRAVDGWKHNSALLLASWMACPWILGWKLFLTDFFLSSSHLPVESDSWSCNFHFFHLAFFLAFACS